MQTNTFHKIRQAIVLGLATVMGVLTLTAASQLVVPSASAINVIDKADSGKLKEAKDQGSRTKVNAQIAVITNILFFLIGTIAVIAIIIGGIRYTTSNGDASQTKAAKDTIMYAVIGLVVAIMAAGIVNFVVGRF